MTDHLKKRVWVRIVDDDEDVRQSLSFVLQCKGWQVCDYAGAREFLTHDAPSQPGCLLLDIRMPDMSGVELQAHMRRRRMALPIIFITGHADVDTAVHTLKSGALDFLQKPVNTDVLVQAIEHACEISLAQSLGRLTPEQLQEVVREMSAREREITQLLINNVSNKEIAERFGLSERTVQGHRNNVYRKLRVHNFAEFVEVCRTVDFSRHEN